MTKLNQNLLDDYSIVQGNDYEFKILVPEVGPADIDEARWAVVDRHGDDALLEVTLGAGEITKASDGGTGTLLTVRLTQAQTLLVEPGTYKHETNIDYDTTTRKEVARGKVVWLNATLT